MKTKFLIALLFTAIIFYPLPEESFAQRTWIKKAEFPGSSRFFSVSCSVGTKGYFGMGQKQVKEYSYKIYNDFWEYDSEKNVWTQKADFPDGGRLMSRAFVVNGKCYVGFGYQLVANGPNIGSNDYQEDFYEFNFSENAWSKKTNNYIGAKDVFFVFNDTLCSVNPEDRTIKKYCALTDTWTSAKYPKKVISPNYLQVMENSSGFSVGEKGYLITFIRKKRQYINQLWEFDSHMMTWNARNDLPGLGSDTISSFSVGEKKYVIRGGKKILEYNPKSDTWSEKRELSLPDQNFSFLFAIGEKLYGFSKHELWEVAP